MGFDEGSKRFPVFYLVAMTRVVMRPGMKVSCFRSQPKPLVGRVTAKVEKLAGFASKHTVEFDCFDNFTAQVIVIGFWHLGGPPAGYLFYDVLTCLAVAIRSCLVIGNICKHQSPRRQPQTYLQREPNLAHPSQPVTGKQTNLVSLSSSRHTV